MAWSKTFSSREAFDAGTDSGDPEIDAGQYAAARAAAQTLLDAKIIPVAETDPDHQARWNEHAKQVHEEVILNSGLPGAPFVPRTDITHATVRITLRGETKTAAKEISVKIAEI